MMDITQETQKKQVAIPRFTEKDFEVPVFTEDDFKPQNLGGTPPVQAGIEAPQQEKQGYFQGLGRKFKAGLNTVGEMITEIPQAAEALSDLPTKMLADGMINREVKRGNIDRETAFVLKQNKDTFIPQSNFGQVLPAMPGAETIGDAIADGRINKWFENNAKALSESATRYDKTATEYLKNKQFGKALGAISYGIAESLPATLAALVAPEGALMLGLGTGAQKYDEVKDNEDMSEAMKVADAFTTGMFEWLFEKFGTAEMGKYLGNYVRRTGKDGIQKAFTSGPVMDLISKGYKKFGIWFAPMHEGVSEVLTTMGQNAATKYTGENPDVEIMDNTIESFLVGAGMGGLFSSTAALANKVRGGTPQQPINQLDPDQGVKDIINVYGERLKFNSNVPLAEDQNPLMSIASHKIEDKKYFLTGESGKLGDHVFTGYDYDALKEVGYDFTQVTPRLIKASDIRERMDIPYNEWLQSEVDLYKQTQVQGQQLMTKAQAPVQEGQEITLGDKTFNVTFVDENGITLNEIDKQGNLTEGELIVPPEDYEKVFGVPAVDNGGVSQENVTEQGLQPQNIVTEQGQSASVDNTLIPQLPVNKKGEIEYEKITEPDMYAQGLAQEFGEDAPAILEELIAEQIAALEKAKKGTNAIERARKVKSINAEIKKLEGVKEILTPTATTTQSASPVVEAPVVETVIESDQQSTAQDLARPEEIEQPSVEETEVQTSPGETAPVEAELQEAGEVIEEQEEEPAQPTGRQPLSSFKKGDRVKNVTGDVWEVVDIPADKEQKAILKDPSDNSTVEWNQKIVSWTLEKPASAKKNPEVELIKANAEVDTKPTEEDIREVLKKWNEEWDKQYKRLKGLKNVSIDKITENTNRRLGISLDYYSKYIVPNLEKPTDDSPEDEQALINKQQREEADDLRRRINLRSPKELNKPAFNKLIEDKTVSLASDKGGYDILPSVYVRFGEPITDKEGKPVESTNYYTGKKEKGISVYRAFFDKKTGKYILASGGEDYLSTQDSFTDTKRKIYLVEGEVEDYGSDGENVLRKDSFKQVSEINPDDVVTEQDRNLTFAGNELSETPSWAETDVVDVRELIATEYLKAKANNTNKELIDSVDELLGSNKTQSPEVQLIKANDQVDTNPTEAQKEAENYKMGHVRIKGLDITIQNPVGSVRKGTDKKGNEWAIILNNTYGYIRGTVSPEGKGKKKDQVDVFLGDNLDSDSVYVIDQIDPETGKFDEPKVMIGFNSLQDAKDNYLANYEPGWKGLGDISKMSMDAFKEWVFDKEATQKPLAYKEVADEKQEPIEIEEPAPDFAGEALDNTGVIRLTDKGIELAKKYQKKQEAPKDDIDKLNDLFAERPEKTGEEQARDIAREANSNGAPEKLLKGLTLPNEVLGFFKSLKKSELSRYTWSVYGKGFRPYNANKIREFFAHVHNRLNRSDAEVLKTLGFNTDLIEKTTADSITFKNGVYLNIQSGEYQGNRNHFFAGTQVSFQGYVEKQLMSLVDNGKLTLEQAQEIENETPNKVDTGATGTYKDAQSYINSIRNPDKKKFAEDYNKWVQDGKPEGKEPVYGGKSAIAQQAVRWDINKFYENKQKEQQTSQPETKQYKYKMSARPFDIGTYPKEGFIKAEDDPKGGFQILTYDRKLTEKERNHWSFLPLTEVDELKDKQFEDPDGEYFVDLEWMPNYSGADVSMFDSKNQLVEKPYFMSTNEILKNIESGYWTEKKEVETQKTEDKKLQNIIIQSPEEKHTDEEDNITAQKDIDRGFKVWKTFFREKGTEEWRKAYLLSAPFLTKANALQSAKFQLIADSKNIPIGRENEVMANFEFKAEEVTKQEEQSSLSPIQQKQIAKINSAMGVKYATDEKPELKFLEDVLPSKKPDKKDKIRVDDVSGEFRIKPIIQNIKTKTEDDALKNAVAIDPLRPIMEGIYYDADNQVKIASDAKIMVVIPTKITGKSRIINPKTKHTLEGIYPNYKSVIPQNVFVAKVNALDILNMVSGIDRANAFVESWGDEVAITAKINYDDKSIEFNPAMLKRAITALLESGTIDIRFEFPPSPSSALVIRDMNNSNKFALVMPVMAGNRTSTILNTKTNIDPDIIKKGLKKLQEENWAEKYHAKELSEAKDKFSIEYHTKGLEEAKNERLSQIKELEARLADITNEKTIETPIVANNTEGRTAETVETKPIDKESLPKLEDFGEKIGGARKDLGITRTARDTDSMPAWRRKYHYANADRTMNLGAPIDTSKPFIVQWSKEIATWNGKRTVYHDVTTIDTRKIKVFNSEEEAEAYIPIYEVWKQNFRIRKSGENYVITKTSSTGKVVEYGTFPTEEDATTYMYSTEGATSLLNHKREDFSIPALDKVERTGTDWRKGRDVTTEEFMETFGFRGGEFGNWVKPEERRVMLNAAYDSFMDLAEILNVPPTALSFGGELSIAFGARGVKGAAAHFEPGRAVINLTRMNGAGSLAHEWAHAMDNYFGIQGAKKDYARDEKGEVKAGNVMRTTSDLLSIQGMRKELSEKFDKIVEATQSKSVTRVMGIEEKQKAYDKQMAAAQREGEALVKKFENGVRRYKYNRQTKRQEETIVKATPDQVKKARAIVDKILEGKGTRPKWDRIPESKSRFGDYSYISPETLALNELHKEVFGRTGLKRDGDGFYNLGYFVDKMYHAKGILDKALAGESETLNVATDFLKTSKEFDKTRAKPYWATKVEMFARAFEYFVQTKLEENNVRADYLQYDKAPVYDAVYGKNPYPSAEERAELNRLFQEFFDEVKVRTDENNVSLLYENEADYIKDQLDGYDSEDQRQTAVEEAIHQTEGRVLDSGLRSTGDILQKVLPRTVLKGFKESGYVDFIGQKIESPQDIADLWAIHRSPYIEKAHLIFVRNGKIVATTASTINRIGSSMFMKPQDVLRLYNKYKADGVYYLHNHPSGNHQTSLQDIITTNAHYMALERGGANLLGALVIDHNKFSYIDIKNNPIEDGDFYSSEEVEDYRKNRVQELEYKNPVSKLFHERESIQEGGQERMFEIARALLTENNYKGALVYVSSNLEISAYDVFPEGASAKDIIRLAKEGLKSNLGRSVVFIHDGSYGNELSINGQLPYDTLDVINTAKNESQWFSKEPRKGYANVVADKLWDEESEYKKSEFAGEYLEGKQNITQTPAFKKWFGDSKVVDENGKPLVVYHGTINDFDSFDLSKTGISTDSGMWGKGFYFSISPEYAGSYANRSNRVGSIIPAYLSIKNPLIINNSRDIPAIVTSGNPEHSPDIYSNKFRDYLLKNGYDGIIAHGDEFVALSPAQIKSATGNKGTFDPENPSILEEQQAPYQFAGDWLAKKPDPGPNPDLLKSAAQVYKEKEAKRTIPETIQGIREYIQDMNLPIRKFEEEVLKRGGKQDNNSKPYRDTSLSFGRQEKLYTDFFEQKMKPILRSISKMKKAGIPGEEVLPYVISKHAIERNAVMRGKELREWVDANQDATPDEIDAKREELKDKDYSGVMAFDTKKQYKNPDELAWDIVREFESRVDKSLIDELWSNVKTATQATLETWEAGNQLSPDQKKEYQEQYRYFVPLRGWRDDAAKELVYTRGEGFSNSLKKAEGRKSLADNPLAYILSVQFQAIAEQVDNEVKISMYNLIARNLNNPEINELATIKKLYNVKVKLPDGTEAWMETDARPAPELFASGDAKTKIYREHERLRKPRNAREHEVIVRKPGGDMIIVFKKKHLTTAQALNKQNYMFRAIWGGIYDARDMNKVMSMMGYFNNMLKALYTSWNVVFPFTNFMRDFQEASITQSIKQGTGLKVMINYRGAFPAVFRNLIGKPNLNNQLDRDLQDFYTLGGATGYTHTKTIEEIEKEVDREVDRLVREGTLTGSMKNGFRTTMRAIETWNKVFEDATRFSVYLSSIAAGNSKQDAAIDAKEASVNFNRKGKGSKAWDSWFAFFNVAMQSLQKNFKLAKDHGGKFSAIAGSFIMMGFLEALMNAMTDDDEPDSSYYNINPYMRQNYLIIPNLPRLLTTGEKGNKYLSIPLPQFWRGFKSIGAIAFDIATRKMTVKDGIMDALGNFASGLLPVDVGGFWKSGEFSFAPIAPTIFKPGVEVLENRNYMGYTIKNEPFTRDQEKSLANAGLGKNNVSPAAKYLTDMLFRWGGGKGKYKYYYDQEKGESHKVPGLLDINPSSIEHLFKGYTGGTGTGFSDLITTVVQATSPDQDIDFRNVPFLNRFIRKIPEDKWNIIGEYYDLRDDAKINSDLQKEAVKEAERTGDWSEVTAMYGNEYLQRYHETFRYYESELDDAMKMKDFDLVEGNRLSVEIMERAIQDIQRLKQEYGKK